MSTPRRILLVRLSHLGDVVHALTVRNALRAAWPAAELAWAVQPEFAALVDEGPADGAQEAEPLTRAILFDRRGGARAWMALRAELEAFDADWAIDAQGNVKSALVTLASGAARRSGLARADWTEALGACALTDRAAPARGPHAMDRMAALVAHVAPQGALDPEPGPRLAARELADGRVRLAAWLGIAQDDLAAGARDAVLLHLSSAEDVRAWPGARFAELARRLAAEGRTVLVLSGPHERELGSALAAQLAGVRGIRHVVGQRGLRELAAVLCAAASLELGFAACDTGPLHLAWATGMSVTCLAGPQDALRTGPWPVPGGDGGADRGDRHVVVRAAQQPACAPCLSRRCSHPEGTVCMQRIEAADVARALGRRPSFAR